MQNCGSPLVLRLCPLGFGRVLAYDELYIKLNDVKGENFCSSIDGLLQMRDPILASKFNRLQLFSVRPLLYEFRRKLGSEIGILRPSRPSTCSLFNHGTNQCRYRTGQVANLAKRDNSILIYTPNYCRAGIEFNRLYTVYLFEGAFSKSIKQNLMFCIQSNNFKTDKRFSIMKIKLFLKTIWGKIISCQCVIKTLLMFLGISYRYI